MGMREQVVGKNIPNMKRLLFVAHRIPYPPNKGDKIRSFNELKFLSRHYSVDLLSLVDNATDLKYVIDLKHYCDQVKLFQLNSKSATIKGGLALLAGRSLSSRYFYVKEMQTTFDSWLQEREYDAVFCFSSSMAEYIFRSRAFSKHSSGKSPRLIMDLCDVDSDKWRQYAQDSIFPLKQLYELESRRLELYESKIHRSFDHTVLVSSGEAELFRANCPDCENLSVITNGVDVTYFSPVLETPAAELNNKPPTILFTGTMDYPVNISGVLWFVRNVWPQLIQKYPTLKFYIVGNNPVAEVRQLAKKSNIVVTGFVDDIRDYYKLADVFVAPLHLGRGIQNKVLEAMAMGIPTITTSKANAGIQGNAGEHLLIADSADAFINAISCLLNDRGQAARLASAARDFVVSHYDWDVNMLKLQKIALKQWSSITDRRKVADRRTQENKPTYDRRKRPDRRRENIAMKWVHNY